MATRQERLEAQLSKKERDLSLAAEFAKKVVSPLLANILEDGYTPAFPMTKRQVRVYGRDAVRCFVLMFKLLQRGGRNKQGVPFKSHWVVNRAALKPYIEWSQMEAPLSVLHEMLVEAGTSEEVWNRVSKRWINKVIRDAARVAKKRKEEQNGNISHNK